MNEIRQDKECETHVDEHKDELFDLTRLRLSQNFSEVAGVKKALTTVPVRKPSPQDFIRVRKGKDKKLETAILELKEDSESYIVEPSLWPALYGELIPKVLYTTMNRQGVLFLWPIRLPDENGRLDPWNQSALEAAEFAQEKWIRIKSNRSLGAYEVYEATGELSEPEWPTLKFEQILKVAFKGKFIESMDHPVISRLRGEF